MYVTVCSSYQMKSTDNIETEFAEVTADPLKQGSSTHGPRATDSPRSSLPWPADHFEKNNYKRD